MDQRSDEEDEGYARQSTAQHMPYIRCARTFCRATKKIEEINLTNSRGGLAKVVCCACQANPRYMVMITCPRTLCQAKKITEDIKLTNARGGFPKLICGKCSGMIGSEKWLCPCGEKWTKCPRRRGVRLGERRRKEKPLSKEVLIGRFLKLEDCRRADSSRAHCPVRQ